MDIEKLKTDISLWPEGAEFCAFLQEKDHTVTDFFKDGVVIIPRPTEQKMEELKPRELACFEQVAKVIGEENAEVELQRVIDRPDCHNGAIKPRKLMTAFNWAASPQKSAFWELIDKGIKPSVYAVSEKAPVKSDKEISDGSTASYYELPEGSKELQDLISHRDMNGQVAEIFRACYRYGLVSHSDMMRDAKKIKFYAEAEIKRLEKLDGGRGN